MNNKNRYIHEAGSIAVLLIAAASILFFTVFGVKNRWQNGLRETVQNVLDTQYPETYKVARFCQINAPFAVSAAVFEVTNLTNPENPRDTFTENRTTAENAPAVHTTGKDVRDVAGNASLQSADSERSGTAADFGSRDGGAAQNETAANDATKAADSKNVPTVHGTYAVIIRAAAVSGSVPLVYVFEGENAVFAGIGGEKEKLHLPDAQTAHLEYALLLSRYGLTEKIVSFWQNRARLLIPHTKEGQ